MPDDREGRLLDAFVQVAGALVDDYDVVEVLQTVVDAAVDLFAADAAGIMIADQDSELEVVVSTSARSASTDLMQLEVGEGPCIESYRNGTVVTVSDREEMRRRWPRFAEASERAGYAAVHSVPLRTRDQVLGSMNLFRNAPGTLDGRDATAARALTDVATITILQQRSTDHAARTQAQLQQALDSRIAIEQAKGFVAHTHGVDVDTAFALLRGYARSHGMLLRDVAQQVTDRTVTIPGADAPVSC